MSKSINRVILAALILTAKAISWNNAAKIKQTAPEDKYVNLSRFIDKTLGLKQ